MLRSRKIPGLSRCRLVVPDVFSGVRSHRDNGGQKQVIAAVRAADVSIPRRAVADTEIQQVEFGIVGNRVPDRATAPVRPPFARPGFCRILKRFTFKAFGRVAWYLI